MLGANKVLDVDLFLGFPLTEEFQKSLALLPQAESSLFLKGGQGLESVTFEGSGYLGKRCGHLVDIHSLELLENNIFSLLFKLFPSFPFKDKPLFLLALDKLVQTP